MAFSTLRTKVRKSGSQCPRCKRDFGTTPNPLVCNPGPDDMLKRRGSNAHCVPCHGFCAVNPKFKDLTGKELLEAIDADQKTYDDEREEYEATKRGGRKFKAAKTTEVRGEARNSLSTRQLLGYLWSQQLLKKHGLQELWNSMPHQTIQHMGKKLSGVMREENAVGAVEVFQDSQISAVRSHHVCEHDEDSQGDADECFQDISKQLQVSAVDQEGEGQSGFSLKSKRAKLAKAEDEDFMSLWGVGPVLSHDKDKEKTDDAGPSQPARQAKRQKSGHTAKAKLSAGQVLGGGGGQSAAGEDVQSEAGATEVASSSSWLFGGKVRAINKGKGSKELDATEKVIQQFESLRKQFKDESNFISITFNKAKLMQEKLEARSSEDLQKVYREASNGPDSTRAVDIMRRLVEANTEMVVVIQLVSAIHDAEATADTLQAAIDEVETTGLSLPSSLKKMHLARALQEVFKAGDFVEYFKKLESECLAKIFGEDSGAEIADFRFHAVSSNLVKFLHQEITPPSIEDAKCKKDPGEKLTAEDKESLAKERAAAEKAYAHKLTGQLLEFLKKFCEDGLTTDWLESKHASLTACIEETNQLRTVVSVAARECSDSLKADEVESVKNARAACLQKKGLFHESLTLFPLGQYVQQSCNAALESFHKDRACVAELDTLVSMAGAMRTFTAEGLFKTNSLEIAIPHQARCVELVQKLILVEQTSSETFKTEYAEKLKLVQLKLDELAGAVMEAAIVKFQKTCGDGLATGLESLSKGQLSTESTASFIEVLGTAKSFLPLPVLTMQKLLGYNSKHIQATVASLRSFFAELMQALPIVAVVLDFEKATSKDAQLSCSRLLDPSMATLMASFEQDSNQSALKQFVPQVSTLLSQIEVKIRENAMKLLAIEAESFVKFVNFLSQDVGTSEKGLLQEIVGEFQEEEDDKAMIDFSGFYKIYGAKLPADWSPMPTQSTAGVEISATSAGLCAAGALLPLAKRVVHLSLWVKKMATVTTSSVAFSKPAADQPDARYHGCLLHFLADKASEPGKLTHSLRNAFAAAQVTGQATAKAFVAGCAVRVVEMLGRVVDAAATDFADLKGELIRTHGKFQGIEQFKASLAAGKVDARLCDGLCSDNGMQPMFLFLTGGLPLMKEVQSFLMSVVAALGQGLGDLGEIALLPETCVRANNAIENFKVFLEAEGSDSDTVVVLASMQQTVADATVGQAFCRDLRTGETRQGLVNRAMNGVRKRGWKVHPTLVSRTAALLSGKALNK